MTEHQLDLTVESIISTVRSDSDSDTIYLYVIYFFVKPYWDASLIVLQSYMCI